MNDMWPNRPTAKFPALPLVEARTIQENPRSSEVVTVHGRCRDIETNKRKPFFVYVHAMPHVPLSLRSLGKSRPDCSAMSLKRSTGPSAKFSREKPISKNTLVIFTSDVAGLSYGNHAGSAGPLREGKGTSFDGGVRVPFVARFPGKIPPGTTCNQPAMTIDLLPTIAKLTGADLPKLSIDGKDITTLLTSEKGAKSPQDAYFFYWGQELQAVSWASELHFPHDYRCSKGGQRGQARPTQTSKPRSLCMTWKPTSISRRCVSCEFKNRARNQVLADRIRTDLGM
jgi:hypothetical protein